MSDLYYKESLLDHFFCSSYVQQHRFSTEWDNLSHGMAICQKNFAAKTEKKTSIFKNLSSDQCEEFFFCGFRFSTSGLVVKHVLSLLGKKMKKKPKNIDFGGWC
jgi:hypothetical protein